MFFFGDNDSNFLANKNLQKGWMLDGKFKLVTEDNLEDFLKDILSSTTGYCAIDTETDSLNTSVFNKKTVATISGFSVSSKDYHGYYIPVNHLPPYDKHNLSDSSVRRIFEEIINSKLIIIFHNAKYDQELLQFNGGEPYGGRKYGAWDDINKWEDTMILAYLKDTKGRKGLKYLSKELLDREMIKFNDLFPEKEKEKNFRKLDPTNINVLTYACCDAVCTFALYFALREDALALNDGKTQKVIYAIEKMCLTSTRWMERARIQIDIELILKLIKETHKEYLDTISSAYNSINEFLGRDITPLSFLLLKENLIKQNPSLEHKRVGDPNHIDAIWKQSEKQAELMRKNFLMSSLDSKYYSETYKELIKRIDHKNKKAFYDINSPDQLGNLLVELNIEDLEKTDKGNIKTDEATLDKILEKAGSKYKFLEIILKIRKLQKAIGTYLYHLYDDSNKNKICYDCGEAFESGGSCPKCNSANIDFDNSVKVPFDGFRTDTGRFAVKTSKNDDGYARFPLHSMPATYDPDSLSVYLQLRKALKARRGFMVLPCDYAGVELRIATNLSFEKKWVKEYFRCSKCNADFSGDENPPISVCPYCKTETIGDLHTLTTLAIFGEDSKNLPDFKNLRQKGKKINFSLLYGGGPASVDRSITCGKNESYRIKNKFDSTYNELFNFWKDTVNFAKKNKYVLTAFGRKYPVPDIHHEDGGFRAKAERNSINAPVQGTSADITKISMGLAYLKFKNKGWIDPFNTATDKARMLITMHDELVFEIKEELIEEAVKVIEEVMVGNKFIKKLGWKVPIAMTVEIGDSWDADYGYYEYLHGVKPWPEALKKYFKAAKESTTIEIKKEEEKKIEIFEYILENPTISSCAALAENLYHSKDDAGVDIVVYIIDKDGSKKQLSLPISGLKIDKEKFLENK